MSMARCRDPSARSWSPGSGLGLGSGSGLERAQLVTKAAVDGGEVGVSRPQVGVAPDGGLQVRHRL
eukprot:scaffold71869_cov46-Phaeocystis_antarctica.AAC.1